MPSSRSNLPGQRRSLRPIGLLLLTIVATTALTEGGLRAWLWSRGTPFSSNAAQEDIRSILQGMVGLATGIEDGAIASPRTPARGSAYKIHPYTGYTHSLGLQTEAEAIAYFADGQPQDEYSIFFLGGSVAAGFQAGAAPILEDLFAQGLGLNGRRVRLFGLAVPGHKQPQQLLALTYLLSQGCRPDLVINMDGLNELRITLSNTHAGLDPSFPSVGHWSSLLSEGRGSDTPELIYAMLRPQQEAARIGEAALTNGTTRSAVLSLWTLSRLRQRQADRAAAQEVVVLARAEVQRAGKAAGFGTGTPRERALEHALRCWFDSSLAMHDLSSARGIRYMHWLQPTLHDAGSKPIHPVEQRVGIGEQGMNPVVVEGYPLLRERLVELQRLGVEALDASDAFLHESGRVYRDSCHFTGGGNRLLLERVIALVEGE
jgi:hypothetical protein